jgi:hypothetical protein
MQQPTRDTPLRCSTAVREALCIPNIYTRLLDHKHNRQPRTDTSQPARRCTGQRHLRNGLYRVNVNRYQNLVINWVHFGTLIAIFVKIGTVKASFYRTMKIKF